MFKHKLDDKTDLRLVEARYAEECCKLIENNKDQLKVWLPWAENNKLDDTKAFIKSAMKQYSENKGFHAFIFYDNELAGTIGYNTIDWSNKSCSIGYWLAEKHVGKGIMTKACTVMVEYALNDLDLNRVEIRCGEENHRSRAIPKRLGFKEEGMIREAELIRGEFISHYIYGIVKSEWSGQ